MRALKAIMLIILHQIECMIANCDVVKQKIVCGFFLIVVIVKLPYVETKASNLLPRYRGQQEINRLSCRCPSVVLRWASV